MLTMLMQPMQKAARLISGVSTYMKVTISKDGSISIGRKHIYIPNTTVQDNVGQGANGMVFLGKNKYLNRNVAIKLWIKLKKRDCRDKFQQGIEEAKKASECEGQGVIKIFDAGESNGLFYCVMEYFEGTTLRKWLTSKHPCLYQRITFAEALSAPIRNLTCKSINHGDLHWGNILLSEKGDFRIVDFGTSLFVSKQNSIFRHWKVFYEMVNKLVSPFDLFKFYESEYPLCYYIESGTILDIFESFLRRWYVLIHYAIAYADKNIWLSEVTKKYASNFVLTDKEKGEVENLVNSGKLKVTNDFIGWHSPWGREDEILPII